MRPIGPAFTVATAAAGGIWIGSTTGTRSAAAPPAAAADPTGPPASLVGRDMQVYFRGVDDIQFPYRSGTTPTVQRVQWLGGVVTAVRPRWIEVRSEARPAQTGMWVPTESVAYIVAEDVPWVPATQP